MCGCWRAPPWRRMTRGARQQLLEWLRSTGYRDAVTENILDGASAG